MNRANLRPIGTIVVVQRVRAMNRRGLRPVELELLRRAAVRRELLLERRRLQWRRWLGPALLCVGALAIVVANLWH